MSGVIHLHLPASWETWRRLTEDDLDPCEPRDGFVGRTELVWLPESVHSELAEKAMQAGWTYGQLLGYLAIQALVHAARPPGA